MKIPVIALAVVLLIFYWASTIPSFIITEIFGVPIDVANPLYLFGQLIIFTLCGFSITIQHVLIALMILLFATGIFSK